MKKRYTSRRYKRINATRSRKRLRSKVKRAKNKYSPSNEYFPPRVFSRSRLVTLKAPENFSLIENTNEVLEYFNQARSYLRKGNSVDLDISKIKSLTPDAIALLVARLRDKQFHHDRGVKGNAPEDKMLKQIFLQSGFYDFVDSEEKPKRLDHLVNKVSKNFVDDDLAKKYSLIGIRHTFGREFIFDPLYDILIEVMQNTNNHAGENRGDYDWWLHVYRDPAESISKYTFLDLGSGVFESFPATLFRNNLTDMVGLTNNKDLVRPLFNGEIKSSTGRDDRGLGMPQIFESSQNPSFGKFYMIANDVKVDMKTMTITELNGNFSGTLFYWELIDDKGYNGN